MAVSPADDLLGGLWAVIATVFVYRVTYQQSMTAAVSRVAATAVSFALCLIYLIFLPFPLYRGRARRGRPQPARRLAAAHPAAH